MTLDGTSFYDLFTVLLLMRCDFLLRKVYSEQFDDSIKQVMNLLEEKIDRQRHYLQILGQSPFRFLFSTLLLGLIRAVFNGKLADLFLEEVVLSF